ncbi:MAG: cyanophycin synthetase [Granulosicoccus sp.]|jgi:cyanophycin synthetase
MINILELRALRGPNRYSRHPTMFMVLDIKNYETQPSDTLNGFTERLLAVMPSLQEHGCSIGHPGGFVERLRRGTWAGHIIEHIAIELQCLAGMDVGFGKTFGTSKPGVYIVAYRYRVESVGLKVAEQAINLFEAVAGQTTIDIDQMITELKVLREDDMLGPSTLSIVEEAQSRGIPFRRLNNDSYIQLGYGAYQKRIQATMSSQTSAIAVEVADEKAQSKMHLQKSGIPVPHGFLVSTLEEAISAFDSIDGSVVVKPDVGNHGNGSTIDVETIEQLKIAFQIAKAMHRRVIVEEYVKGFDFRLLVINGTLVAAAKREPAHVIGDGESSIQELIDRTNLDPRRGFGHEKMLTRIDIDSMTETILMSRDLQLTSIPATGETVYLKATANLSQGGTATDVTDEVSPDIRLMAERAARIIGLDCVGVDALALDISQPLGPSGIKVVEVNAAPGFRMHLEPTHGKPRMVAKPFVDMLFPDDYVQVPVIAVTGTNGKTTTCKLITHSLKYAGKKVGLACTTGVEIDGVSILTGDYSGPEGAGIVVREPTVDHIILEVARGGIVRRGLGVDELDIGVLLNIGEDHLGTDWVETQEDLSLVKSTVLEVVKETGTSVLNADDAVTMSVLDRARGNIIFFSLDPNNDHLTKNVENGKTVITLKDRDVIIRNSDLDITVAALEEIPITFAGIVEFNVSNTLAAIAALYGLGLTIDQIRNGVTTFYPSVNQNPGRMNLFDFREYKVLLDYGHNADSAIAIAKLLPRLSPGRKVGLCHGTGNRTNEQIIEYGKALALVYDYILLCDFDPRGRDPGETTALVRQGLLEAGFDKNNIEIIAENSDAIDAIFSKATPGDLLVIQPDALEPVMSQIQARYLKILF